MFFNPDPQKFTNSSIIPIIAQQKKSSSSQPKGAPLVSRKAKNRVLAPLLPLATDGLCRSISQFLRFLLGYTPEHRHYPDGPTPAQIAKVPATLSKETIMNDQSIFASCSSLLVNAENKHDWSPFRTLLDSDLANNGIEQFTGEWGAIVGEKSRWNQVMIWFSVKHWKFAKRAGAFFNYAMETKWDQDVVLIGVVSRWFRGRIDEQKQKFLDPAKIKQRERTRKRREVSKCCLTQVTCMCDETDTLECQQLYEYRLATVKKYLPAYSSLLPDSDCCSETEMDPDQQFQRSLRLTWRATKYGDWLHQIDRLSFLHQSTVKGRNKATRRFDTSRQEGESYNPLAPVCGGLPEECYTQDTLKNDDLDKKALVIQPSSSLLDDAVKAINELLAN